MLKAADLVLTATGQEGKSQWGENGALIPWSKKGLLGFLPAPAS